MKILAHRGYWRTLEERNSIQALELALKKGYGFESDVRDYCGKIVISHNPADEKCFESEIVFEELEKYHDDFCFAINIKADGLKDELLEQITRHEIKNYFCFDMSVPQMVEFIEEGLIVFTRQSEYEQVPVFYQESKGVWIDGFENLDWITENLLSEHIKNGKIICIVSPELHQRPHRDFWGKLNKMNLDFSKVYLCTDVPDEANEYFGEKI